MCASRAVEAHEKYGTLIMDCIEDDLGQGVAEGSMTLPNVERTV